MIFTMYRLSKFLNYQLSSALALITRNFKKNNNKKSDFNTQRERGRERYELLCERGVGEEKRKFWKVRLCKVFIRMLR